MHQKQEKTEERDRKVVTSKLKATRDCNEHGGPWELKHVKSELQKLPTKEHKHKALVAQLRFHKTVLSSKGQKELFRETIKGQKLTNDA